MRLHPAEFVAINVIAASRLTLFPWQKINELCVDGDTAEVEVLGPGIRPDDPWFDREQTVGAMIRYRPNMYINMRSVTPSDHGDVCIQRPWIWIMQTLVFNIENIGITGNFNEWKAPLPLSRVSRYEFQMRSPPRALLLFRFVRDGKFVFSSNSDTVLDTEKQKFHYHKVLPSGTIFLIPEEGVPLVTPRLSGTPLNRRLLDPTVTAAMQLSQADIAVRRRMGRDSDSRSY